MNDNNHLNQSEIDEQKNIVNEFEKEVSESIKQIIPVQENEFIILTNDKYPNNMYIAEYHDSVDKPSLLKEEKASPTLLIKGLVNIEAHEDISLGGVEQDRWNE